MLGQVRLFISKLVGSVFVAVGALVAVGACSANPQDVSNATCHAGVEGCSCSNAGETAACGTEISQTDTTVTCGIGQATCTNGAWSACTNEHTETRNLPGMIMNANGISTDGKSVPCTNLCDPNQCQSYEDGPGDVDASGFAIVDGALSLQQGDSNGTGPCNGLGCNVVKCQGNATTSISGFVYDPAGVNPLYNVYVYVPVDPKGTIATLPTGATKDQCANQTTITAVTVTTTAVDGSFKLTGVPSGVNIPLVVQSGQWRREIMLSAGSVQQCVNNTVSTSSCVSAISNANCTLRLPRNHTDGYDWTNATYDFADVPQLAIVTGNADPFECLLLKIGIDPNEFGSTTKNSTRRVHFFESPDDPGTVLASTFGNRVTGDQLWNTSSILPNYAAILLPCEGAAVDKMKPTKSGIPYTKNTPPNGVDPYANMINYANAGGRVFATHFSYVWMQYPQLFGYVTGDNWGAVATWDHTYSTLLGMNTSSYSTQDPLNATIDQTFTKGAAFAQWLLDVGASASLGSLALHQARHDSTALGSTTQDWSIANDTGSGVTPQSYNPNFTFNTPYPAVPANQYGRVVFSDFHVSSNALTNTNNQNSCTANTDCGFTQTCNGYQPAVPGSCTETCYSASDCANTSYTCHGGQLGTCVAKACTKNNQCASNKCTGGTCACSSNSQCASGVCSGGVCTASTCESSSQCGSVQTCGGTLVQGTCTKSCTTQSQCTGGELCVDSNHNLCVNGPCTCSGCTTSTQCSSKLANPTCTGVQPTQYGTCSPAIPNGAPNNSNGWFPYACANQPMIAQEEALEFMFFDLTSCVAPDTGNQGNGPPPYKSATFTQDFTGSCASGQSIKWREFDWQANIPTGTSIVFAAQSGATTTTLLNATPVTIATTTTSTSLPNFDAAIIDTSTGGTTSGTGPFNTASPPIRSDAVLRMTITMNPDTTQTLTPTLSNWKVQYDCADSQ